jgi:adenine-specific DNA-methyltransferase
MSKYNCEKCGIEFNQKIQYTKHQKSDCNNFNNCTEVNLGYSLLSKELTNKLSNDVKKNNGIYFTPPSCVNKNIELLKPYMTTVRTVLEPSCGSCEYITALHKVFPQLSLTGIEHNQTIYNSIVQYMNSKIDLINMDFLKYETDKKYDLIIGNPPYFVMKKQDVDKKHHTYFEGRPNIFILFIIKSVNLLNDNGILSFVLPKNFLNCLYYDKTRKYLVTNFQILTIIECNDKYIETQQDTILLILQKTVNPDLISNNQFMLQINDYTIFFTKENKKRITKLRKYSSSLSELGYKVSVGTVVWNQCKSLLTDDETKTRLIYSSDIENSTLIKKHYDNQDKKNFINKTGIKRPMIVINRGYGVGEYKFNYCLIEETHDYLVENHLICIEFKTELEPNKLIALYKKILLSLDDERTTEFIKMYFGNNAINTTELNNILPIYHDI